MHNFLFGIYPYIALSVLILGSIARHERDPFTWKSSSSQLLRRKQLIIGSVLFLMVVGVTAQLSVGSEQTPVGDLEIGLFLVPFAVRHRFPLLEPCAESLEVDGTIGFIALSM